MKLDRNIDGRNKYGLILRRKLEDAERVHSPQGLTEIQHAISVLEHAGIIDWGNTPETEFFVMRLKDKYAGGALAQYAINAVYDGEVEFGQEVQALAARAGTNHPSCKKPD